MASKPSFCSSFRWGVEEARSNCKTSSSLESGICEVDVFFTIVIETESLVNARPLTHVRSDIEDEDPLTPNHFLIGRALPDVPACVFKETPTIQTKTWSQVRQRLEAIWKRLLKEYIPSLNTRKKWLKPDAKLEVNDIVWVLEEWTPRGIWPLGRVTRTFTGPDKTARSCEVKTALELLNPTSC